jgi:hypothetical protein
LRWTNGENTAQAAVRNVIFGGFVLLAALGGLTRPALAQEASACPVAPQPDWTEGETFTWNELCAGRNVDLATAYDDLTATIDVDKWKPVRTLRAAFLKRIMTDPAYVNALPYSGISIAGVYIPDDLNLSDLRFDKPLVIYYSVFGRPLVMQRYRTNATVNLYSNWFRYQAPADAKDNPSNTALDLTAAEIGKGLNLSKAYVNGDTNLVDLKVAENVWLSDSFFLSNLWMDRSTIGGVVFANTLVVGTQWSLDGADIAKNLQITDLEISTAPPDGPKQYGRLSGNQLHVGGMLQLGSSPNQIRMPQILGGQPAPQANAEAVPAETATTEPAPAGIDAGASLPDGAQTDTNLPATGAPSPGVADGALPPASNDGATGDRPFSVVLDRIDLIGARIDGEMRIRRPWIGNMISLEDVVVGDDLWLTDGDIGYVGFSGTSVSGFVLLQGSRIGNSMLFDSGTVGRSLVMDDKTHISRSFNLPGTNIKGGIYFAGATIDGVTNLNSITVDHDVILGGGTTFTDLVDLSFARIGGSLDFTGGKFASVDMTGARIAAELRLAAAGSVPQFADNAELTLRNVTTNSLQDVAAAWPRVLHLEGFSYQRQIRSDGGDANAAGDGGDRADQLIGWLARQQPFSPQPYQQLAGILRQSGDNETAKAILFAGKQREWDVAHGWSKFWLSLQFLFTGFGVHPQVAGLWVLALIAFGTWAFSRDPAPELAKLTWPQRAIYSFDMLLPAVHLRHHHYEIELHGWPRYYLYIHKIMGYVLLTFLAAALLSGGGFE